MAAGHQPDRSCVPESDITGFVTDDDTLWERVEGSSQSYCVRACLGDRLRSLPGDLLEVAENWLDTLLVGGSHPETVGERGEALLEVALA